MLREISLLLDSKCPSSDLYTIYMPSVQFSLFVFSLLDSPVYLPCLNISCLTLGYICLIKVQDTRHSSKTVKCHNSKSTVPCARIYGCACHELTQCPRALSSFFSFSLLSTCWTSY